MTFAKMRDIIILLPLASDVSVLAIVLQGSFLEISVKRPVQTQFSLTLLKATPVMVLTAVVL